MGNRDPYEILGIPRNASQDDIRKAYRELVKKYHPDKYQGNPLADLAEEKLQEVNWAYDTLTKNGGASAQSQSYGGYSYGASGSSYSGGAYSYGSSSAESQYGSYTGSSPIYNQIRAYINSNNISAAEQLLLQNRAEDAEWHFLYGVVSFKLGRIAEGLQDVQTAVQMDPSNVEYQNAYSQMNSVGSMYQGMSADQGYGMNPLCWTLPLCFCC
ncbi:MAG: DnaJ domain-containing protein [Eubacterium sp.]|jgi:molecular chaperone DnaJ